MVDHVTIRVSDREASERFYDTVLRTLGIEQSYSFPLRPRTSR
jgi:catechol 2,3-dioxygenase-like lactoylglutathione lyase family enzyme